MDLPAAATMRAIEGVGRNRSIKLSTESTRISAQIRSSMSAGSRKSAQLFEEEVWLAVVRVCKCVVGELNSLHV